MTGLLRAGAAGAALAAASVNCAPAAYGRTANGIVNYTTPWDSNDFTGEVYGLVRPGRPLDTRSPFPRRDLSGNPVSESFERYRGGFANAATTSNRIQFGGGADFVQRNAGAPRQFQFGLAYRF